MDVSIFVLHTCQKDMGLGISLQNELDFIPKYDGFELSTKEEYEAWNKAHGLN